jgi:hypothetical protein
MAVSPVATPWIAQRTVLAVDADGGEFPLTLAAGAPYETGTGDWACAARLDGLDPKPVALFGIDSWQALQLAMQYIAHRLHSFTAQGGQLLWPEEREPVSVAELIPHIG